MEKKKKMEVKHENCIILFTLRCSARILITVGPIDQLVEH